MTKEEVLNALDVIEKEYQIDIRKTQARLKKIKEELYHIPDLKSKYEANSFTEKEAAIVDEYEDLILGSFLCLQRKNEKIRALKDKIENDAKKMLEIFDGDYPNVLQGTATNNFSKVKGSHKNFETMPYSTKAKTTQKIGDDDFTVMIENFSEKSCLRASTQKLLMALLIEFTETGGQDTSITLPLRKYMQWRGLTNEVSARRQVNEALETLYSISLSFTQNKRQKRKKFSRDYRDMRLVIDKGIKNGVIKCTFHPEFYELLKSYTVMPINRKMLMLDDRRNPHAFYFLKFLSEYVNMNYGKPNQNIISVKSLLNSSPEMPTYEEIQSQNRHYDERIIEPFIRDMNVLQDIQAIIWHFEDSDCVKSWDSFIKAKIHFELLNYPLRALPDKKTTNKA